MMTIQNTRAATAALGFGLTLGLLAGPVSAQETRPVNDAKVATAEHIDIKPTDIKPTDIKPTDIKPTDTKPTDVRPTDVRPDRREHDVEVLHLTCDIADGRSDASRIHVGCKWRAATSERAAGYQLWRILDRGERQLVARVGLDTRGVRDVVPAHSSVVRYAVLALSEDGRVVGRSRVEQLMLESGGTNGRIEVEPIRPAAPDRVRWPIAVR
jgi:hypothetical protein